MVKMKKGDLVLIVLLLILSSILYFLLGRRAQASGEKYISVQVDGEETEKIKLGQVDNIKELNIETIYGNCILEYDSDSCRIIKSECPDKLCIKQGEITQVGQVIVCLPFRVVVEIVGETETTGNDADVINF